MVVAIAGGKRPATVQTVVAIAVIVLGCGGTLVRIRSAQAEQPPSVAVRVGIDNHYKVGHWTPVKVVARGLETTNAPRLEVVVTDSDGVETTAAAPFAKSTSDSNSWTATAYTKVGRLGAPLRARLTGGDGTLVAQVVRPGAHDEAAAALVDLPATGELLASLGSRSIGLREAYPERQESGSDLARRTIELAGVDSLPTDWIGYESLDVLVLSLGEGAVARALAEDTTRFAALAQWVELGGHLVILCSGDRAESLAAEAGPLAALLPGDFVDVVNLTELGPLEHFAEPAPPIAVTGRAPSLRVPRLSNVQGQIEVFAGRQPTDLPLVVRTARGLGEVLFVGFDLAAPPLAEWPGRRTLLQALLRPIVVTGGPQDESQRIMARGYNDLAGALRQQIGRSFASSVPIPFALVAVLAMCYLLILGPIDYLLVRRWLRRPLAAWITLPLILVLFGAGAMGLAEWRRGANGLTANQVELIDIDTTAGFARGTLWTTVYSPRANRYDLGLQLAPPFQAAAPSGSDAPLLPAGETGEASSDGSLPPAKVAISAWGLAGRGIGGMHARGAELVAFENGYRYSDGAQSLERLPILDSATKSIIARWKAPAVKLFEADLTEVQGLAAGTLTNRTGRSLHNARLLYEGWGYWLGNMADGQQIEVGEQLSARRAKTIITGSVLGRASAGSGQPAGTLFLPERASALELLNLMMFYQAAGGLDFAQLPNRYHAFCDLSGLLKPGMGRAIFVAESTEPDSRLVDKSSGAAIGDPGSHSAVVFRIVVPVAKSEEAP